MAPLQAISLMVTRILRSTQEGRPVEEKAHWGGGGGERSLVSAGVPVCFSCGRQGHGVNRCSQVDTSFPFLPLGWSVDVRNGQYRATRIEGTELGSASRIIGDQGSTDAGGGVGSSRRRPPSWQLPVGRGLGSHWAPNTQAFPSLGRQSKTDRGQNDRELLDRTEGVLGSGNQLVPISPVEMDGSSWSVVPLASRARKNRRGMRPAGGIRPCPPRV